MTLTIGVSLKMYFGYDQTVRWCRTVADRLGGHPALRGGGARLFVLPAFPAIAPAAAAFRDTPIAVGAQNLSAADSGAFTGEVSGAMVREAGARYVEVGHAERRALFGEDESTVAAKTAAALRNGLVPVLCLGEDRRMPAADAAAECVRQLSSALHAADRQGLGGMVVVAYEPVWAIGAERPAGEDHITAVCAVLRQAVTARHGRAGSTVIYGGSAGPGLLTRVAGAVDGLFLGRFAHDPGALESVIDEAGALA
ncbi:triose-phosphate isomerase family protein [Acrocarpospora catenulata]|uniref:triose-phosphate isomerase family protein n=1 Tax=Acrocarpospora catenulata TaxID=2836182 RepID=UPI0027E0B6B2|nr:triose-phosphate isomerase family protein [Acrocarpospora catenulata]